MEIDKIYYSKNKKDGIYIFCTIEKSYGEYCEVKIVYIHPGNSNKIINPYIFDSETLHPLNTIDDPEILFEIVNKINAI